MKQKLGTVAKVSFAALVLAPILAVCAVLISWQMTAHEVPRETFTQTRWEELDSAGEDRGGLVDSLLEQYDGLKGMNFSEVQALLGDLGEPLRANPEQGAYKAEYWIGQGRDGSTGNELMALQFMDGQVFSVSFESTDW